MADISITAANVGIAPSSANGVRVKIVQVGEAVTQGETLYKDTSTNKYMLGDADEGGGEDLVEGIALTPASTDGYVVMLTKGPIKIGGTVAEGMVYILSDTAGGIKPIGDVASGDKTTIIGVATSTSVIDVQIDATGAETA